MRVVGKGGVKQRFRGLGGRRFPLFADVTGARTEGEWLHQNRSEGVNRGGDVVTGGAHRLGGVLIGWSLV
jgi:hypothetical protein